MLSGLAMLATGDRKGARNGVLNAAAR